MRNERIESIDYIKALAIIMVVIAHCIEYGSGSVYLYNKDFFNNHIFKTITAFHMPLFMFVSGFLMFRNNYNNLGIFIKKKIRGLIIPAIMWSLLFESVTVFYKLTFGGGDYRALYYQIIQSKL